MNVALKIVCALSLYLNVWVAYAVPLKSIFFREETKRVWFDLNGRSIEAKLIAVSPDGSKCYFEKDSQYASLDVDFCQLSAVDKAYIKSTLIKNNYILYRGEYRKVYGYLNEEYLCLSGGIDGCANALISVMDLNQEWGTVIKNQSLKGLLNLERYDRKLIEKTREYLKLPEDHKREFLEVENVLNDGLVVKVKIMIRGGIEIKSRSFISNKGFDSSNYNVGDILPSGKEWYFAGFVERVVNGKNEILSCYFSDIEDVVRLSVGWMSVHHNDRYVINRLDMKSIYDGYDKKGNESIVIIKGSRGQGTGFIYIDDGKTYLYTNEHVARLGKNIYAEDLKGKKYLFPKQVQVAIDRDLLRFEVVAEKYLWGQEKISINDEVKVCGNSDGGGVVTEICGQVLGVGPTRIEVDAPFVKGNSGSPILYHIRIVEGGRFVGYSNMGVVGVATEAEYKYEPDDWGKIGSRFNKPRRYGERLINVDWDVVSWDAYCVSVSKLESFRDVCKVLCILYVGENVGSEEYENVNKLGNHRLCALVKELQRRNLSGGENTKAIEEGLEIVVKLLKKTKWATPRIANDGEQLLKSIEALQKFVKEGRRLGRSKNPSFSSRKDRIVGQNADKREDRRYRIRLEGAQIIADDGTFLGRITWNNCASDSIFNSVGQYGSEVSSTSIWNDISKYGSDYSSESAFNDFASSPPRILKGGEVIGYLTTNDCKARAINPKCLLEILDKNADEMYRKKLLRIK